MKKYYLGTGVENTPPRELDKLAGIASVLNNQGYTIRTSSMTEADKIMQKINTSFEVYENYTAVSKDKIYLATLLSSTVISKWGKLNSKTRDLMITKVFQIYGYDLDNPVDFVVCYYVPGKSISQVTLKYILDLAQAGNIPIYNLAIKDEFERFVKDKVSLM